ncbi:conserved hypothetical protein [Ricinus communis]|uniref:Uncharacterized protein n=1 Tax=Ricinus communis TaxID=3988 RepID=B9SL29_RICCO|nr:conserved hypothetical protein [Ricinus communis]
MVGADERSTLRERGVDWEIEKERRGKIGKHDVEIFAGRRKLLLWREGEHRSH